LIGSFDSRREIIALQQSLTRGKLNFRNCEVTQEALTKDDQACCIELHNGGKQLHRSFNDGCGHFGVSDVHKAIRLIRDRLQG
jgi:hypothetical protein